MVLRRRSGVAAAGGGRGPQGGFGGPLYPLGSAPEGGDPLGPRTVGGAPLCRGPQGGLAGAPEPHPRGPQGLDLRGQPKGPRGSGSPFHEPL